MAKWLKDSGEMAERVRKHDWAGTPLGPIEAWSPELKSAVAFVLENRFPAALVWGMSLVTIYNDGFRPILGNKPDALGRSFAEIWKEAWQEVGPIAWRAFAGHSTFIEDFSLLIDRTGVPEEAFFTFSYSPVRAADGSVLGIVDTVVETTDKVRSRTALRASEDRQAFLLKLSDALRPLSDPIAVQVEASRLIGEYLGVARAAYGELESNEQFMTVARDWSRPGIASAVGRFELDAFGKFFSNRLRAGDAAIVEDAATHPHVPRDRYASTWAAIGVRSSIAYPIVKQGRLCAAFFIHGDHPRRWLDSEITLVSEVAERTWETVERARAEAALRESEERFRQFAEASSGALWIRNAKSLEMEYTSPAIARIYGVERDGFPTDVKHWAALVVPEDREAALENLEQARAGKAVVHEFRIQRPSDRAFRWIRNTRFPLFDQQGRVQRIGGIAEDITQEKLALEHQGVLLAELQHRVRNIMAMIRSVTARTGERAESVPEYSSLLSGRLLALARVQALLTRAANAAVGVRTVVHDEVSVQAHHEGQYLLAGPDVELSAKAAEVLTLAIHELATNALKYGALSVPSGCVTVRWNTFEKHGTQWLGLDWTEEGAPVPSQSDPAKQRRRGFGSELIEARIPYELGGRGKVSIEPGGARCHIEFPLREGASILATDAPQRATVFGGALDMSGEADLTGHRILIVEDDYYLATDTARALKGAGAEVLGPCPTEETARKLLEDHTPSGAVLDINLGSGPSFKLASILKASRIPFVFVTGYDEETIPPEFASVARLQKPMDFRQMVGSLASALGMTPQ